MSHLTKSASGHLVKQSGSGHLVKGGGDCGGWSPGSCLSTVEFTLSGMNSALLDLCLVSGGGFPKGVKVPSAGEGSFSVDGTYSSTLLIDDLPEYCYYRHVSDDAFSSTGSYYNATDCTGGAAGSWAADQILLAVWVTSAGVITRATVSLGDVGVAESVVVFETGTIAADFGDTLVNTLFGGIGSLVVTP